MLGSVVAALVLFGQVSPNQGKFEIGERLRELDHVWSITTDRSRRLAAIPKITAATKAILNESAGDACLALDEASAALQGRKAQPSDAVSLRFDPAFAEPRTTARLRISWAYMPTDPRPVTVQVGRQAIVATPGRTLVVEVKPEQINPEILLNPEVGFLMPVQVASEQRSVFLSIIKKPLERLNSLKTTKQPEAATIVRLLEKVVGNPESFTYDVPIIQYLFTAELLDEGRLRLDRADNLPLVVHKGTSFRANFPRQVRGPLTLVVALHGSEATEATFYEAYGQGRAVAEAVKRNWAFVAPRASGTAVADVIDWIKSRRKQPIERIFLIGHNSGAAIALDQTGISPAPKAIAAFAPAISRLPATVDGIPLYIAIGKQDELAPVLRGIAQQLGSRRNSRFAEVDACDHLMVVGESMAEAYRFFDTHAGR